MKKPKIKLIKDPEVTDHTYYEDCMYMSNSMLKTFIDKCPKYYAYRIENPIRPTQAMKFGTAFHMLVLEGVTKFTKNYIKEPDVDKRTTLGKTTLAKFRESIGDKEAISSKDYETMMSMYDHLLEHKHIDILDSCNEKEEIYLWKNEDIDILCKGKFDAVNSRDKYIVDLKTTRNASPEKFKELLMNAKYHMQAAYYLDALGYSDYFIVAIEKDKPHCICTYKLSKEMINEGRELYMNALKSYKDIIISGKDVGLRDLSMSEIDYNSGEICEI
jgi:hypothetical protein